MERVKSVVQNVFGIIGGLLVGFLVGGGVLIPLLSDDYTAKQALLAIVIPPYGWYIAAVQAFQWLT